MKITKQQLKQIIKEEMRTVLREDEPFDAEEALYDAVVGGGATNNDPWVDDGEWRELSYTGAIAEMVEEITSPEEIDWYAKLIISLFYNPNEMSEVLQGMEQSQVNQLLTTRENLYDNFNLEDEL